MSDPFGRVQRTAPAVTPPADVVIGPPETGLGTAPGAGPTVTRRRALSVLAGAGVAAVIGVTACDRSQHQQVSSGLTSPGLKSASLTGAGLKAARLKAPGIWRFQTPGPVVEGLVAVGGFVYTADNNDNGGSHSHNVYALDATTGVAVWMAANYAESYTGPAVGNDRVYVGSDFHTVTALNARTGHMAWQYVTGDVVTGAPAVHGNSVYIGCGINDNHIYALDAISGRPRWKYETGSSAFGRPAATSRAVYAGGDDGNVYALDAATGRLLWSFPAGGPVVGQLAAVHGVVFAGCGSSIYAIDARSGNQLWRFGTGGAVQAGLAVARVRPARPAAYSSTTHSGALGAQTAIRSPGR